ncbi:LysR family transcriptional regulator [Brevibacterium atlanticum]|uniref:LysR family transcriptional regulator n=1 Tax=Brevibacterium atlanticum TaxID=2697563 RepID=UPI001D183102|nr:LysR family transcriptional regulator [Brevibacterium atlanticum]
MNFQDLRYFLALTRYGRLSIAAQRLEVEHTTIRRRVSALEKDLGVRLFDKTPSGWVLTAAGQRLLPHAQKIEQEADAAQAAVSDRKHRPQGTVRIVATDGFGGGVIAPSLGRLRAEYPEIDVELVTTSNLLSYAVGEFDIAVTLHRPERPGFSMTHLCEYDLRLYGNSRYLDQNPPISEERDLSAHDIVWFVESLLDLPELQSAQGLATKANIVFRTTNLFAQVEAAASGVGLGLLPCFLAHHDSRLQPVLHSRVRARRSFWMIVPSRLANTERVSAVCEHLVAMARAEAGRLVPPIDTDEYGDPMEGVERE